jgi:hypothetical protein
MVKQKMYLGPMRTELTSASLRLRKSVSRARGPEIFGDKIWWNNLRPIHGLLYLLFSYNAIIGNQNSWIYLLIDVSFGLISFLTKHFIFKNYL